MQKTESAIENNGRAYGPNDLIPICCYCHKLRTPARKWVKSNIRPGEEADLKFTHGICPACLKRHYPEYA